MDKGNFTGDLKEVEFDPFAGPEIIRVAPAIDPQLEIWISCLIGGEDANRSYNESLSLRLTGVFNQAAMEHALQDIIDRHEALRSSFSADGTQICIYKTWPLSLRFEDLSLNDLPAQQLFVKNFSKLDAETSFDLLNGPLFRIALFKLNETTHYLTITAHHIVCDGWSLGILMQDLSKLYSAYAKGETPMLPAAPSFSDFAVEQRQFSQSEAYNEIEQYWIDRYKDNIPLLDVPTDFPRPLDRTYKSHRQDYLLDKELISAVKKMGAKAGCSLVSTIIASFEVFLRRLTGGQQDIVLGLPAAGQSATNNYGLVGHCVNLLPLRSHPEGELAFNDYLKQRKSKIFDDYDHQQFTFGRLLKKLNIPRDASRVPLIPVVLNIDMGLDNDVEFLGLKHELVYNPREYETFEIFLNATGSEQSLILEWSYNTQLFRPATIKRMMDEFEFLLRQVVKDPSLKIRDIPLMNAEGLNEKLSAWNNTASPYPKDKAVHHLIADKARQYPAKTAIRYNKQSLTYKDLNDKANQLASFLLDSGIKPGDIIGLAIDRSPDMLIVLLAIMKSGAAYIPIDPEYPQGRIEFMLEDSSATILFTSKKYQAKFHSRAREILMEDAWLKMASHAAEDVKVKVDGNGLAYILYTSGSTGKPKGVQIEHHNLVNFLLSMQKTPGMNADDRLLSVTTVSFDISGLELYLPLVTGAELFITDTDTAKDGRLLLDLVKKENITIMQATPSTWKIMLELGWEKPIPLKVLCGGEALPKDLANKLVERCSELWNMYGPTETTIWSTVKQITADGDITIGRPIDNTQVYILDEYMKLLADGAVGEIYIAGDGVARGYRNRPELTAEKFVSNPFTKEVNTKMYRTGDLGKFLADGEVQCLGRIDHQVKIRGYRIELGEIEHSLIKQDGVKEAVVIAREDKPGNQQLVAYIVPAKGTDAGNAAISTALLQKWKQKLKELLPAYMVPNDFIFIAELPLTPNGKIDIKALPKPDQQGEGENKKYIAPQSDTEKLVAGIWAELLGLEKVSMDDDFFELGGHSVIAAQVMTRLEKETGRRLPLTSLFKYPVLEQIVALFQEDKTIDSNAPGADAMNVEDGEPEKILAPAIEPQVEIWLSCILGGEDANRSFNLAMSEHLHGPMNEIAMKRALQELINRHESLRTTFNWDTREICIYKKWPLDLNTEDLSSMDPEQQRSFIHDFSKKNAETSFDFLKGPLHRMSLLKLGDKEYYLTFAVHHMICDGWSLGVLMQEAGKLYSAYVKNEIPSLPEAPLFSKYAIKQKEFSESKEYKEIEQYWVGQFIDGAPVLNVRTDFPRPEIRTYKSQRDDYDLAPEIISGIKKIGKKTGCSMAITLRAAFEIFLYRLTGQDDIVLGLPAAAQLSTGNYGLVGHCVNLLPLRSKLKGGVSFMEYLKQRKPAILDAYDHQELTFGSLLKKLNTARDKSRVPLVPVVFNIEIGMDDGVYFEGMTHEMTFHPREYESFDIFLNTGGSEESPTLQWSYNTQLFKPATIKRMMDEFEFLLREIVKDPSLRIRDIPVMDAEGLHAKLKTWNATFSAYPKDKAVPHLIAEKARQYGGKIAIRYNKESLTYKDLNDKANQLASFLVNSGIRPGDIVGLAVDRSPKMVIALLAIMKSGAAYLPIDPEYPQGRIEFMLEDSSANFLFTSKKYKGLFHSQANEILMEDAWAKLSSYGTEDVQVKVGGNDLAYILYTSGSTGKPKGVQIEQHNLVNFLLSMKKNPGMNAEDRLLAVTTISFDIAGLELYLPLITGAELFITDTATAKDGRLLMDIVKLENITVMQATPSTWRMMLELGWDKPLALKILCGGEALPKDLANKLVGRCKELWNMYGPTETTIWSTVKQITADGDINIGRPIDNTQVYILDDHLNPLTEGAVGEIYIGGDGVARGYFNRPELTTERFIENPFSDTAGEKIYRTGDLGKFTEDGEVVCLGRTDHQLKIRGYRIELGEIEYSLTKQKGVKEAVVVAHEDQLVAYLVPIDNKEEAISAEQSMKLKEGLRLLLPEYMVPADFVLIKKLPLTPNGKIDRNALPKYEQHAGSRKGKYVAPRTDVEKLIADIWADVLGMEKVSIHDDFFELGGHSLIAVQVMARLEKETGKRLPLAGLFNAPTIEKMALMIGEDGRSVSWNSLVPIKPQGSKMPLYLVHGFGMNVLLFNNLAKNMDPEQPVFALQARGLNGIDEPLDKMEDIAAYYISEILAQNPGNAFALAGYSFGGIIAFEMAKQLKAMGKEIKMLAIFDTYADNSTYFDSWKTRLAKKIRRQIPKTRFILNSLVRHPKETFQYQSKFVKRIFGEWFGKKEAKKPLTNEDKVGEKYYHAYLNYQLTPYDGSIDLFKVNTRLYYLDDLVYLGWKPFVKKGITIHEISGDHKTFLIAPHDKDFAKILQTCLNERTAKKEYSKDFSRENEVLKVV